MHARHAIPILIPILGLLLVPSVSGAAAAPATLPAGARLLDAWAREDRQLVVADEPDGARFTSLRSSALGEDELHGRFDRDELALRHTFVSTEPGNATVITFSLQWAALLEFQDLGANGRYDLGDPVLQRLGLVGRPGTELRSEPRASGSHAILAHVLLNQSAGGSLLPVGNPPTPGTLDLELLVTPSSTQSGGRAVLPTEVAINLSLHGFPFQRNDTRLALEVRAQSSTDLEPAGLRMAAMQGVFLTAYAWSPTATIDGRAVPAPTTVLEAPRGAPGSEAAQQVALLTDLGQAGTATAEASLAVERYELPPVGAVVEVPAPLRGDWATYAAGAFATAVVAGGAAFARLRRSP